MLGDVTQEPRHFRKWSDENKCWETPCGLSWDRGTTGLKYTVDVQFVSCLRCLLNIQRDSERWITLRHLRVDSGNGRSGLSLCGVKWKYGDKDVHHTLSIQDTTCDACIDAWDEKLRKEEEAALAGMPAEFHRKWDSMTIEQREEWIIDNT